MGNDWDRDKCCEEWKPPAYASGTEVTAGYYNCAVKGGVLKKRYSDDSPPLIAGLRLKEEFFNDLDRRDGFSVNCCQCLSEPRCTLTLLGHTGFRSVIRINLPNLRERLPELEIVAMYKPKGDNKCHYDLIALDVQESEFKAKLRALFRSIDMDFLHGGKNKPLPTKDSELTTIKTATSRAADLFSVVLQDD
jgi:hypothetical protein